MINRAKIHCEPKMEGALRPFLGPAFLVAIGYLDPGNWATDIEAGAEYGYELLWVVLLSSGLAMFLQYLCVRMGVHKRVHLAEACRLNCPKWLNLVLYGLAEMAIIACDVAEVIGTAIALKLLFGVPLRFGVFMTAFDVILLMTGICDGSEPVLNVIMIGLLCAITLAFLLQMFIVKPSIVSILEGLTTVKILKREPKYWMCILGILGATVMPHNLYLHSYLIKSKTKYQEAEDQIQDDNSTFYFTIDLIIALSIAFLVNSGILIVAAAAFHKVAEQQNEFKSIEDAAYLLKENMGMLSFILFGATLLASGLTSTLTGTLAGQIVFEGFLNVEMAIWKRRLVTRSLAIAPAVIMIYCAGNDAFQKMLLYSQVILSIQLPFAVIPLAMFAFDEPLLQFTGISRREKVLKILTILIVLIICGLDIAAIIVNLI